MIDEEIHLTKKDFKRVVDNADIGDMIDARAKAMMGED